MPEGRIVPVKGGYDYQYNLTDHLGNVREVFHPKSDGTAELLQENHYYPFGLEMPGLGYVKQAPESKYRFNGKELQDNNNLTMLDFGARFYDPQIGRWWSLDPMAEKMYNHSPFNFTFNNPLKFIDIDGMMPWPVAETYFSDLETYDRGINSGFYRNWDINVRHGAVDIAFAIVENDIKMTKGIEGATVMSTHDGVVIDAGNDEDEKGNYVTVQNGNVRTEYMHMKDLPLVKTGDKVNEGQAIGVLGNTGSSEGPHLHYVIRIFNGDKWVAINPVEGDQKQVKDFTDKVSLKDAQKLCKTWNTPVTLKGNNTEKTYQNNEFGSGGIEFNADGSITLTLSSRDEVY